ncbi:uncharacterized protein ColSpa_12194 [Colletotrichum spaethianum]|uniref:Uncharacterized protein n=1 Tax=Colletotrichum spaethianum TaxID=700344 RepID=A0AA37PGR2_9PEZI|nr:uncharacterized protein ColSpa_12194 [Colletotrichum spaethianum]GKT52013.1 hypothetical protein ColSpa_12194 [Colletotrichum spaethianum]GKT61220.1 hypothetical protein ColTof3_08559 [Colletotrichum tofieldiae]GKT68887.1 hypothetical protein ColTof4_01310 [Colletotrichum tofieldiae]
MRAVGDHMASNKARYATFASASKTSVWWTNGSDPRKICRVAWYPTQPAPAAVMLPSNIWEP